jgi:hypothetical protein
VPPEFDELVGEVDPGERRRLRRAHDLLIAAGPPAELPPSLRAPPGAADTPDVVLVLPRGFLPPRRVAAAVVVAAALALAMFGAGFLVGDRGEGFESVRIVSMHGTGLQRDARASLELGEKDASGNWPMLLRVRGLPELKSPRGYYEVLLTRDGEPIAPCGSFRVHAGTTQVSLNAPYELREFDGWVVVVHARGHIDDPPVVLVSAV